MAGLSITSAAGRNGRWIVALRSTEVSTVLPLLAFPRSTFHLPFIFPIHCHLALFTSDDVVIVFPVFVTRFLFVCGVYLKVPPYICDVTVLHRYLRSPFYHVALPFTVYFSPRCHLDTELFMSGDVTSCHDVSRVVSFMTCFVVYMWHLLKPPYIRFLRRCRAEHVSRTGYARIMLAAYTRCPEIK